MTWLSGPCISEDPDATDGVLVQGAFGTRFDDRSGGTFWWVDLGGSVVSGFTDTASEARQIIADYQRAQTAVLRFRGPRSVYGGDG